MAAPWIAYIPVPGLSVVAVWMAPADPLTRYHARQGLVLVLGLFLMWLLLGLLARASDAPAYLATLGLIGGLVLLAGIVGITIGIISALRSRYGRIRPAWDLLAALGA